MPRHILIKLSKIKYKEKKLKAAREKQQIAYKGIPMRLTADLSAETLQPRREWQDIFKVMKGKNLQPGLLYLTRISFRFNREIKTFTDKQNLRIQHHLTSFATNAKGNPLVRKETCNLKQPCIYIDCYIKTSWANLGKTSWAKPHSKLKNYSKYTHKKEKATQTQQ